MPKVIASSIVSTSDQIKGYNDEVLIVYYCLCGEYVFIVDQPLNTFPQRKTDKAYVVTKAKHTWKLNVAHDSKPVYIHRQNGYELQLRKQCKRCSSVVAYEPNEHAPYLYLVDGAMVRSPQDNQETEPVTEPSLSAL